MNAHTNKHIYLGAYNMFRKLSIFFVCRLVVFLFLSVSPTTDRPSVRPFSINYYIEWHTLRHKTFLLGIVWLDFYFATRWRSFFFPLSLFQTRSLPSYQWCAYAQLFTHYGIFKWKNVAAYSGAAVATSFFFASSLSFILSPSFGHDWYYRCTISSVLHF